MTIKTVTLHMYAKTGQWDTPGETQVFDVDFRKTPSCMQDLVWLGQTDMQIDFPDIDIRQAHIDKLETQIQQELAQSESRVNLLLDRISKLQAIGHDE